MVGTFATAGMIAGGSFVALRALGMRGRDDIVSNSLALGAVFSSTDTLAALQAIDQVGGAAGARP